MGRVALSLFPPSNLFSKFKGTLCSYSAVQVLTHGVFRGRSLFYFRNLALLTLVWEQKSQPSPTVVILNPWLQSRIPWRVFFFLICRFLDPIPVLLNYNLFWSRNLIFSHKQQLILRNSACNLFFATPHTKCGILVPDWGSNPCFLHWNHGVITTGLLGKSLLITSLENSSSCLTSV